MEKCGKEKGRGRGMGKENEEGKYWRIITMMITMMMMRIKKVKQNAKRITTAIIMIIIKENVMLLHDKDKDKIQCSRPFNVLPLSLQFPLLSIGNHYHNNVNGRWKGPLKGWKNNFLLNCHEHYYFFLLL